MSAANGTATRARPHPLELVRQALVDGGWEPGQEAARYRARCPHCKSAELSLDVKVGGDDRAALWCDRCKQEPDVLAAAMGLRESDLRPLERRPKLAAAPDDRSPKPARTTLRLLDTAHMLASEPPPVDWIAEGIVARGTLTMLAGREKEGKSLLCQALAAAIASGESVGGIACKAGRALIVDAENGQSVTHRRLKGLGLDVDNADNLRFVEARGFDLRRNLDELEQLLAELTPDLLVLDSWRSLWGGKENDSDEVAEVLDPLRMLARERGCGVVLIHHMSRGGAYRGSTAAGASVENLLAFARHPDDPDRRRRQLVNTGCRYDEEASDRWLTIDANRALGAIFVDQAEPFTTSYDDDGAATAAPVREELTPRVRALLLSDIPQTLADLNRELDRHPKDRSVRRVLAGLAETGDAVQLPDKKWIAGGGTVAAPIGVSPPCHPATLACRAKSEGDGDEGPATLLLDVVGSEDAVVDAVRDAFDATEERP